MGKEGKNFFGYKHLKGINSTCAARSDCTLHVLMICWLYIFAGITYKLFGLVDLTGRRPLLDRVLWTRKDKNETSIFVKIRTNFPHG